MKETRMKRIVKIYCRSLGCKVNLSDLADVFDRLPPDRFERTSNPNEADLALVNTCTVTHKADRDVRKIIGSLRREHPDLQVVLTGCSVVNNPRRIEKFENVKVLVPPGNTEAAASAIRSLAGEQECPDTDNRSRTGSPPTSSYLRLGRSRALLKVQDGCNARCTYCIIPNVRGRERSMRPDAVMRRIELLTRQGHREIVLCGIHLGRYGNDLGPDADLPSLLDMLGARFRNLDNGYRIRLSSIEPLEWTPRLADTIEALPFVCRHFHIPLQSGDDEILEKMGRPYRTRKYAAVIEDLRRRFPDAALGADVLVGYPAESEAAASNTLQFVKSLPINYLHVFSFSARPGTPAAELPDKVDSRCARSRSAALRQFGKNRWQEFMKAAVGRCHRVVTERASRHWLHGRSDTYHPFKIDSSQVRAGQMVEVLAKNLDRTRLVGVPCPVR